jgi:hypothetical protein
MNYESIIQSVRSRSLPVHTFPVGWSTKTEQLISILRKNNPYQPVSESVAYEMSRIKKLPELRNYLPWFRVGPGHKEIYAQELSPVIPPQKYKDYSDI